MFQCQVCFRFLPFRFRSHAFLIQRSPFQVLIPGCRHRCSDADGFAKFYYHFGCELLGSMFRIQVLASKHEICYSISCFIFRMSYLRLWVGALRVRVSNQVSCFELDISSLVTQALDLMF